VLLFVPQGARQISSDRFNVAPSPFAKATADKGVKVARPHPGLFPQEKGQKKSVVRPAPLSIPERRRNSSQRQEENQLEAHCFGCATNFF
jgi:hypothetical protein